MKLLSVLEPGARPRKATWYTLTPPGEGPCPRVGHNCLYVPPHPKSGKSKVVIVGGADPNGSFSDGHIIDLERYEWKTTNWEGLLPRYEHASFIPSDSPGSIWVFGGADQAGNRNCLQVLKPETEMWKTPKVTGHLPSPRTFHTGSAAVGNRLYVFGGGDRRAEPVQDTQLHVFDASTLTWSQPRIDGKPPSSRHGHVAVAAGSKLFIHGGLAGDTFYDDLYCIDTKKQHWTLLEFESFLPPGRLDHSMCIIPWQGDSGFKEEDGVKSEDEIEKENLSDGTGGEVGDSDPRNRRETLLCLVFGGMNTEGEIFSDCIATVVD
ncbi:rab9 effector protein with kelch motifs isoform X2 [Ornithorhynchus anatinus]|uniref:rab9 effector protein with kelch motifs isoform X2 n=1 Tax=Ornithorhynchus anatinus TaxID=9258 RepID=UPI0010A83E24|nr:rab9 effector protein with kelch motifs isoform X2 [Ornithorhynchus anatinus]